MAEFPAISFLGQGLNMAIPLLTTKDVRSAMTARPILQINEEDLRPINIGEHLSFGVRTVSLIGSRGKQDGQTYMVPREFTVSQNLSQVETFITFPTGDEAIAKFNSDPAFMSRLIPAAASGNSLLKTLETRFIRSDNQYAFYSLRQPRYSATILSNLNLPFDSETLQQVAIRDLPPFSTENQSVVAQYRRFFQRFGSHVITGVEFGSGYQFIVSADRTQQGVNDAWVEDVKADWGGIPSGGQFDKNIKDSSQYQEYKRLQQRIEMINGGDDALAKAVATNPTYQTFQEWKGSVGHSQPINFSLGDVWTLMKNSNNIEVARAANDIQAAYEWIAHRRKL
ncbi:hypothetical protein AAF712_000363 [Marasmius tenuissimus]|uniref:MACPF domain-containing protein n=1 Tax=Marasmius tenuissimus TaxID=585030 RepID=A0ABR3AF98_9AGAR